MHITAFDDDDDELYSPALTVLNSQERADDYFNSP